MENFDSNLQSQKQQFEGKLKETQAQLDKSIERPYLTDVSSVADVSLVVDTLNRITQRIINAYSLNIKDMPLLKGGNSEILATPINSKTPDVFNGKWEVIDTETKTLIDQNRLTSSPMFQHEMRDLIMHSLSEDYVEQKLAEKGMDIALGKELLVGLLQTEKETPQPAQGSKARPVAQSFLENYVIPLNATLKQVNFVSEIIFLHTQALTNIANAYTSHVADELYKNALSAPGITINTSTTLVLPKIIGEG